MPVHASVSKHIKDLVTYGITNVSEIKQQVKVKVRQQFEGSSVPPTTKREFWPTHKDIYNQVYKLTTSLRNGKEDQQNVDKFRVEWLRDHPEDRMDFRSSEDKDDFIFVYQSQGMRHLLRTYGKIILLDATYKTTRYSLPLFFLCVPTNQNFMVAATFLVKSETSEAIQEALEVIQGWNADWLPQYSMTDFCEAEMSALKTVFPGKH
jgi:hypothetical protein